MAEHDDELDRRITAMLGLAQRDAPAPELAPFPAERRTGRWLAVAAAVVLIGAAGAALAMRDDTTSKASVGTTTPGVDTSLAQSTSTVATSTGPTTTVRLPGEPRDCSVPAVDSYDTVGSMHTIVESSQSLDIEIEALGTPWCPGGTGVVRLTVTNVGAAPEEVNPIQLILSGGMNKYALAHDDSVDDPEVLYIATGSGITVDYHVRVPGVPPGSYSLQLYGFGTGADVRIDGPAACATSDLDAVAGPSDGAGGKVMTPITVTNTGTTSCFLGTPLIVTGTESNGTGGTQIPFDDGGFFPVDDPRPSRALQPGESTSVVLTTDNSCIDDTPHFWATVQLVMDPQFSSTIKVALGPDSRVQTQCGLALTGWATPTR